MRKRFTAEYAESAEVCIAKMKPRDRLLAALASDDYAIRVPELANRLKAEGMGQREMMDLFSEIQITLSGEEACYDSLVDTMDLIYSGPWAKGRGLFDHELTLDADHKEE
ncbi:MAG: hypothetical protein ACIAXF_17640 [Phycisphaerales bacterium JB063]